MKGPIETIHPSHFFGSFSMKFPIPSQLQTTYNQATHFLGNFSLQPITHPIANLTSTWEKLCAPEASFYMQANQEISFRNYQKWRTDFKFSLEDLLQDIVIQYQQGEPFTNESIEQELISLQPTENLSSFSLPYYHSSLEQLALQLPAYASTIDKVNYDYREQLKSHPLKALAHFYHEIINSIIRLSGEQLSLDDLEKSLKYYEKFELVPSSLYQAVLAQLGTFRQNNKPIHSPDPFVMTPNYVYENLIKQINKMFKEEINKRIPAKENNAVLPIQSAQTFFNGSIVNETWKNTQKALSSSWNYLRAHSETILWGTAAVGLGVSILYKLSQTDDLSRTSLSELNEGHPLMKGFSVMTDMATVMNYLSKSPLLPPLLKSAIVTRQMAIPLFTTGLMYLQSVSSQSTERWIKTLGGNMYDAGNSVQQTADDGYIVTGSTNSYGAGNSDLWLSKWTVDGSLSWVKTLGGNGTDIGNFVHNTTDDGYIVTGSTKSFGNGQEDLWLMKWMMNGTLSWAKTLGGSGSDIGYCVQETADGNYIVAGSTDALNNGNSDLWLSKWATNGTLIWVKTLGGPNNDYAYSMQRTADNGYIVGGKTNSFGAGNSDLWLSKWTENGTLTWVKTLGGYADDYCSSVYQTADGGYIAIGSTFSYGAGQLDIWVSKWGEDGSLTWLKSFGGNAYDYGSGVVQIADGSYVVIGYTYSFGNENDINIILSKWMPDGSPIWVKIFGGGNQDFILSIQQTSDGGYITAGVTYSYGVYPVDLWLLKWDDQGSINSCTSPLSLSNQTISINSVNVAINSSTSSIVPQDLEIFAQDVNPFVTTICKPALSDTSSGMFFYTENDPPTVIDGTISVTDIGITTLVSAQVSIVNGFVMNEDELGFHNQNGIVGHYNQTTGILDLTGISVVANYQTALRSITYRDTSDNPSTVLRVFRFIVSDNNQQNSNVIFQNGTVVAVNDAPTLASSNSTVVYDSNSQEDRDLGVPIDVGITIMDPDSSTLKSATLSVTNYVTSEDQLLFSDQNGIIQESSGTDLPLLLGGNATLIDYQTALRSIRYRNANNFTSGYRTIEFTVNDNGQTNSTSNTLVYTLTLISEPIPTSTSTSGTTYSFTSTTGSNPTNFTTGSETTTALLSTGTTSQMPIVTTENPGATTAASAPRATGPNNSGNSVVIYIGVAIAGGIIILAGIGLGIGYRFYKRRGYDFSEAQATELEMPPPPPLSPEAHTDGQDHFLPSTRQPKGHTIIGERYALINSPTRQEAQELLQQTGIKINYKSGEKKSKFVLGQGQFGKLRLALDIKTGQFVGVKKIKGEKAIASSQREAKIQIKLANLPNILPLLHTVEAQGSKDEKVLYQFLFLAGFGNGEELQKRLAQLTNQTLKEPLLIDTAQALLTGMMYMHNAGIYHLDMKSSNFVIDIKGEVYVIDFGCAFETLRPEVDAMRDALCGDGRYFSPERWANCRLYSNFSKLETVARFDPTKADAWALGVTLLEIALNRYPFNHVDNNKRLACCNSQYFKAQLDKIPELQNPPAHSIWAVIKGLLRINPKKRLNMEEALKMPVFQGKREMEFKNKTAFIHLMQQSRGSTLKENLVKKGQSYKEREAYMTTPDYELSPSRSSSEKENRELSTSTSISLSTDESDKTDTDNHSKSEQEKATKRNYIATFNYELSIPSPSGKESEGPYLFTSGESDMTDAEEGPHPKFIYYDNKKERSFTDREEEMDETTELPNKFIPYH